MGISMAAWLRAVSEAVTEKVGERPPLLVGQAGDRDPLVLTGRGEDPVGRGGEVFSAGELSSAHAVLESDCSACHVAWN